MSIQARVVVWKKAQLQEETFGIVTLYQVTPPSFVRRIRPLPIAQPLNASNIRKPLIEGEGTIVPGMVIGVVVGTTVGGTWPDVSSRTMDGATQMALSLVA